MYSPNTWSGQANTEATASKALKRFLRDLAEARKELDHRVEKIGWADWDGEARKELREGKKLIGALLVRITRAHQHAMKTLKERAELIRKSA